MTAERVQARPTFNRFFMNKDGGFDKQEFLVCDIRDDQFLPVAA